MDHPIHSIFVHFPAGLIPISVFFFLLFLFSRRLIFERISVTILGFSSIFLVFTIFTGLWDWNTRFHLFVFPIIILKIILACITLLLISLIWNIRSKYSNNNNISGLTKSNGYIILHLLLFPAILIIGYFGGYLVYPTRVNNHGDNIRIGSVIYIEKCSSCHPYGQGIFDPLLFPKSNEYFGSSSILHSSFLNDKKSLLNYIRNPKEMPKMTTDDLSEYEFDYIYCYLLYLKNGTKSNADSLVIKGEKLYSDYCFICHDKFMEDHASKKNKIFISKSLKSYSEFMSFIKNNHTDIFRKNRIKIDSSFFSRNNIEILYNYLQTKRK